MSDQELEILIHRIVGSWAIDYRVLMAPPALDAIEYHLFEQFTDAIRAAASEARIAERERCVAAVQAARANYPEDVFPSSPAARLVRQVCDDILSEIGD